MAKVHWHSGDEGYTGLLEAEAGAKLIRARYFGTCDEATSALCTVIVSSRPAGTLFADGELATYAESLRRWAAYASRLTHITLYESIEQA